MSHATSTGQGAATHKHGIWIITPPDNILISYYHVPNQPQRKLSLEYVVQKLDGEAISNQHGFLEFKSCLGILNHRITISWKK